MNIHSPRSNASPRARRPNGAEPPAAPGPAQILGRRDPDAGSGGEPAGSRAGDAGLSGAVARLSAGIPVDDAYKNTLPDLQNGPSQPDQGRAAADPACRHLELPPADPLPHPRRRGETDAGNQSVTGTVSLEAEKKGINMSRIMRSFYKHAEATFSFEVIEHALDDYKRDLESFDARIQMRFSFPVKVRALRSGLRAGSITTSRWNWWSGRGAQEDRASRLCLFLDLPVLAGTVANMPAQTRGQLATPHSQRSVARLSVVLDGAECLWFEDLIDLARAGGADRDAGDGQARGRAGLCRTERREPDLRRGCGAAVLRAAAAGPADRRFPGGGEPSGKPAQP
jgi:GTP cyclohydrolase IB